MFVYFYIISVTIIFLLHGDKYTNIIVYVCLLLIAFIVIDFYIFGSRCIARVIKNSNGWLIDGTK